MVAERRQTGQDQVDGSDLQRHAAQQHAVVRGQGRGAEQRPQHVEGQRGQHAGGRRLPDVTCEGAEAGPTTNQRTAGLQGAEESKLK